MGSTQAQIRLGCLEQRPTVNCLDVAIGLAGRLCPRMRTPGCGACLQGWGERSPEGGQLQELSLKQGLDRNMLCILGLL